MIALLAGVSGGAAAQPIDIENAGFEAFDVADDETAFGQEGGLPGWQGTIDFGWGTWNPPQDAYPAEAPEGDNICWLYVNPGEGEVEVDQILGTALQPNTTYTLTYWVGNPQAYFSELNGVFFELDGFPGYQVELLAGGDVLVIDDNTLLPDEGAFQQTTITYTSAPDDARSGAVLGIRLRNLNGPGFCVDFDDLILDAAPACPADLSGDGSIGSADLNLLLAAFGVSGMGDIDADGDTDSTDLNLLLSLFGTDCP